MIEVIKSPTPVVEKTQWAAFLAGPMNGAPSWQAQAPKVAAKVGIENLTLLNPRKTDRFVSGTYQVNWETFGLRMCDVILFWIPPQAYGEVLWGEEDSLDARGCHAGIEGVDGASSRG